MSEQLVLEKDGQTDTVADPDEHSDDAREQVALPDSCTNSLICFIGVAAFVAAILYIRYGPTVSLPVAALACIAAYAVPVIALEMIFLKTHLRPSTGLDYSISRAIDWRRAGTKLLGFYGTMAAIAIAYILLPEYKGDMYRHFWWLLRNVAPYFLVAAIPYFLIVDRFMREPKDAYWQAGRIILGHWHEAEKAVIQQYLLGWLVKAFFLPLMFSFLVGSIMNLANSEVGHGFAGFYGIAWTTLLGIDVLIGCTGYLLTVRVFDSHIRSAEPTLAGWAPAIICYPPVWNNLYGAYFAYNDGTYWGNWLSGSPNLEIFWGSAILALTAVYAWATVVFGVRFSNLTHRGVITSGPFRFTKHPAYLSKNLSWWLISVPFVSMIDWDDAVQHCIMLFGVNIIYFLRARTEERHMSRDPVYVTYALAMNQRSIFRPLAQLVPALRYQPPAEPATWPSPTEIQARPAHAPEAD